MKNNDAQITPEEKEILRRLMETPGVERKWDFFDQMNTDKPIPPPEYFMKGRPECGHRQTIWAAIKSIVVDILMRITVRPGSFVKADPNFDPNQQPPGSETENVGWE